MADFMNEFSGAITADHVICTAGLFVLAGWLLNTSLGRRALDDSVPRRNNMPFYLPFIVLLAWIAGVPTAILARIVLVADLPGWQSAFLDNLILCICSLAAIAVIVLLARSSFARRLEGFGLNVKTIAKDFFVAVLNLLSVWPLVMLMVLATLVFGKLVYGSDFQLQRHQELEMITAYSQPVVRVLIVVTAVLVVPVFEEMLFRGLFQTMLRSFLQRPWPSILISSALFAMIHADVSHWPALLVLAICMGYAYEKSGSLFRPIFIHSLFNAVSIITAIYFQ